MIHSPGSVPQIVALMDMRPASWVFMAQSLYDLQIKEKKTIEGDVCPSSGCPADCLVTVSGKPRTGWRPGQWCWCPYVISLTAHGIHEKILGRIKELNLMPDA